MSSCEVSNLVMSGVDAEDVEDVKVTGNIPQARCVVRFGKGNDVGVVILLHLSFPMIISYVRPP
jgi:hypothetical protein